MINVNKNKNTLDKYTSRGRWPARCVAPRFFSRARHGASRYIAMTHVYCQCRPDALWLSKGRQVWVLVADR